ncbi:GPCR kinase [Tanacetum coccineum]
MAYSLSHTDSEVETLVQKLIDEDKGVQNAILNLALQFENSCTTKDDLRKAYEKCNDISQESRALIDTFLKEGSDKDYELILSMYGKTAKLEKQMDAKLDWLLEKYYYRSQESVGCSSSQADLYLTEKELHQLHVDEEALRETLEENAMDEKAREEKIKQNKLMMMNSFWNLGCLDIDDSDLHLTHVLSSSSSARVEPSPSTPNPVRVNTQGPAGVVSVSLLAHDGAVMSTQEYMQKVVEDVDGNDDFKSGPWISATEYVNANGGTSCSPNGYGDLTVTMKDLSGAAMILANVSIFSLKPSMHYLNITRKNVVKVFCKDTVSGSGNAEEHDKCDEYLTEGFLTEKEQTQLALDEEAYKEYLEEETKAKKERAKAEK